METKAKTIHELHEKFYGKKSKKKDIVDKTKDETKVADVRTDEEKVEAKIDQAIKAVNKAKSIKKVVVKKVDKVQKVKKIRVCRIRKNGVLRIGGNHMIDGFGFKKLQEFIIENPNPGVIVIKGK